MLIRINGGLRLEAFTASSRLNAAWSVFQKLRDLGREAAREWLARHYDAIGRRATLDLSNAYS